MRSMATSAIQLKTRWEWERQLEKEGWSVTRALAPIVDVDNHLILPWEISDGMWPVLPRVYPGVPEVHLQWTKPGFF